VIGIWSCDIMFRVISATRCSCYMQCLGCRSKYSNTETVQLLLRLGGRVVTLEFLEIVYSSSSTGLNQALPVRDLPGLVSMANSPGTGLWIPSKICVCALEHIYLKQHRCSLVVCLWQCHRCWWCQRWRFPSRLSGFRQWWHCKRVMSIEIHLRNINTKYTDAHMYLASSNIH